MCRNNEKHCPALRELREILVDLVDEPEEIRIFVCDIGLEDERINFRNKVLRIWFEVIREAHRRGKLRPLVELVHAEFDKEDERLKVWLESFTCDQLNPDEMIVIE